MRPKYLLAVLAAGCLCSPAGATTKGLNQIVTPDIQPKGVLSISFQQVDPNIANRYEFQLEYGITQKLEVAVFEGFSPQEVILNAEYGLVQQKHFLLSTGLANYSSMGSSPQPYLEAGYLQKATYLMAGAHLRHRAERGRRRLGAGRSPDASDPGRGLPYSPPDAAATGLPGRQRQLLHGGIHLQRHAAASVQPGGLLRQRPRPRRLRLRRADLEYPGVPGLPGLPPVGSGHQAQNASPAQGTGTKQSQP